MKFTKPLSILLKESEESGDHALKRTLNGFNLVALGIGAIIGAGLFSLTGIAAAENAGPAVTISFIIAAVGCTFAALCYAEFASMIPVAGSAYTYSYATMGEVVAWIIGWDLVLEYALGAATVSVSWSSYLVKFLSNIGINFPYEISHAPVDSMTLADGTVISGIINLPAIFIVFALSLLLIKGTKESAFMNALLVALKVAVVLVFIAVGWNYINPENYHPYIPQNTGEWGHFGWSGILRGAAVVFFAYIGFDAVSTAAQESKNPKKDMPIGILGSLIISTILYIVFAYVMTGLANYTDFKGSAAPVAVAIANTPYAWLQQTIIFAILAGFTSVMLVMLLGQSRIFYSMSKDGLLPKVFSSVHPKFHTPYKNNLFFAVFTSLLAGFVNISDLGHMVSIGTLFAFVLVSIGIIIMRKRMPDAPRTFRTPLVPLVPILGILVCVSMMLSLPVVTWIRLFVWMGLGFIIYFTYGIKHSKIRKAEAEKKD
ncbi:amino acid permease [uncultured Acetobacteroides sp.]|uniref:amino acid permease n=1 Tax=uncultured Acetobacteroides sp. TaxID=1760811 RepID=UPI0029F5401B|nr:amino acid permease [uncultured Acetobacteroides sp.]